MIPFPKRSAKASDFLPEIPGIVHHFGDTALIRRDVPFVRKKEPVFCALSGSTRCIAPGWMHPVRVLAVRFADQCTMPVSSSCEQRAFDPRRVDATGPDEVGVAKIRR